MMDLGERGELAATFGILPLATGPLEWVELLRDPYLLVIRAAWRLGEGRPPRLRELRGVPLVGYRTCHSTHEVAALLREGGIEPHIVFQSDDNGTVQAAVAAGLGVALAPQLSLDLGDPGVRTVRTDELPSRTLVLAWHRDRYRSPASRAFQQTA